MALPEHDMGALDLELQVAQKRGRVARNKAPA
jgi:hypothetical protein